MYQPIQICDSGQILWFRMQFYPKFSRGTYFMSCHSSDSLCMCIFVPLSPVFIIHFFFVFCLYNFLFYKIFNTQGIQGRCYKFYLAIPSCPYLIIHIIQLCTLKIIISKLYFFFFKHYKKAYFILQIQMLIDY